jgi:hypothetical protein
MDFEFIAHVVKEDDGSWRRQSMSELTEQFAEKIGFEEAGRIIEVGKTIQGIRSSLAGGDDKG